MKIETKNWMFDQIKKCGDEILHHSVDLNGNYCKSISGCVRSIFAPTLTYEHKSGLMTKRVRSQMQVFGKKVLQKIKEVAIFDKVHNIAI